jgi:hypothetical protein
MGYGVSVFGRVARMIDPQPVEGDGTRILNSRTLQGLISPSVYGACRAKLPEQIEGFW